MKNCVYRLHSNFKTNMKLLLGKSGIVDSGVNCSVALFLSACLTTRLTKLRLQLTQFFRVISKFLLERIFWVYFQLG